MKERVVFICLIFLWLNQPVYGESNSSLNAYKGQPDSIVYTAKKGDWIWNILRNASGGKEEDLPSLYRRFVELNPSIKDPNTLIAGQKIAIPFVKGISSKAREGGIVIDYELYTVKKGETIATILRQTCGIEGDIIFSQYLPLIKELNPEIKDLSKISVGEKIRILRDLQHKTKTQERCLTLSDKEIQKIEGQKIETQEKVLLKKETPSARLIDRDLKKKIRDSISAFIEMGTIAKTDTGFSIPVSGGNISINTQEIPVIAFDSKRYVIVDIDGKIASHDKDRIMRQFPEYKVISAQGKNMEMIADDILNAAGYFSINKDVYPILVGETEKVKFYGKWVVYKTSSLREVCVLNILHDNDKKTPEPIKQYASRFGISLIDIGGIKPDISVPDKDTEKKLNHSFRDLFDALGVAYKPDREIHLGGRAERVDAVYKAPFMVGNVVLSDISPNESIISVLERDHKRFINTSKTPLHEVLGGIYLNVDGPPIKMVILKDRVELELHGMKVENKLILEGPIDTNWYRYLKAKGFEVFAW